MAAHSTLPLEMAPSSAYGLILAAAAHSVGWPFPKGGSQQVSDALGAELRSLGGVIVTDTPVRSLDDVGPVRAVLCDVTPRQLLALAGDRFPESFRRNLRRYRYGPGAFKVDWALSDAIPWKAAGCRRAGTVHLGGSIDDIAASEAQTWEGKPHMRPFVLLSQPTLFDPTRAPHPYHTAWAYCHVPNGCDADMTDRVESQVERFAPGFRDLILARHVMTPATLEKHNPNLVGGDINGGLQNLRQLFFRPTRYLYATPSEKVYICSSSTPPGGGVHGMCGYFAAQAVLRRAAAD
jgi:phytoene dehydrogenase-like protein